MGLLSAQTLTNETYSALPGDVFPTNTTTYQDPGPTGANQTWNFSSLGSTGQANLSYVTPASTGQAASYPGSTAALDAGAGNFVFYAGTPTGWELRGIYSSALGNAIVYSDPERQIPYPFSYNTAWSDDFSANFSSFGTPVARSGSITGLADGFGTLVMPYGTVTNVLRVTVVEDYTDVLTGLGNIEYDFTSVNWFKPGTRAPLLTFNEENTNTLGEVATETRGTWLAGSAVGIEDLLRNAIGVELFPNPATDAVTVTYSTEGGSLQLELFDTTGRLVRSEGITSAMGIGQHVLDVSGLPAGLYQVRITATNGQSGVQRLLVQ